MMTREQRELAYQAVAILRRQVGDTHADAVSQALADVHEYETHVPQPITFDSTGGWCAPTQSELATGIPDAAPEILNYWVVYVYRDSDGAQVLGACRYQSDTPVLTCDDRYAVAFSLANQMGRTVTVLSVELMANEETS